MDKKEQANNFFKEGKYDEAIVLYSEILDEDEDNHLVLSNRSATYIKMGKYDEALVDAARCTKLKPEWGKSWGRLGAALHGQCNYDDALVAYNKANELEPCEVYEKMIVSIKERFSELKKKLVNESLPKELKNSQMGDMFSTMFDTVVDNPKIMEKLIDPAFQSKVMSMQTNPIDALKDQEVMDIMMEMMKGMKVNK
jgi:stress-induced-phosphoprotein 1